MGYTLNKVLLLIWPISPAAAWDKPLQREVRYLTFYLTFDYSDTAGSAIHSNGGISYEIIPYNGLCLIPSYYMEIPGGAR